jgi:hypothetical protein
MDHADLPRSAEHGHAGTHSPNAPEAAQREEQ